MHWGQKNEQKTKDEGSWNSLFPFPYNLTDSLDRK